MVYQILNLLISFDSSSICHLQPDVVVAPLPTEKHLWEAPDAIVWQTVNEKKAALRVEFGLSKDGQLVKMARSKALINEVNSLGRCLETEVPSGSTSSLAEWCSVMDSLGGLVMLAASLMGT